MAQYSPVASGSSMNFPYGIMNGLGNTNALLRIPFQASVLYRMKACLLVQVSGTPMHQGTLLLSAMPFGVPVSRKQDTNSAIASPHAFLSANNSTVTCLPIPFYAHQTLAQCDINSTAPLPPVDREYATISLTVLNPLVAPSSGSTSLTVTMHLVFENADFYIPHLDANYLQYNPFTSFSGLISGHLDSFFKSAKTGSAKFTGDLFDLARGTIRSYTGLHNLNHSDNYDRKIVGTRNFPNVVDSETAYERLNPYSKFTRISTEPIFETFVDEMDMKYILSKKYYLDTFRVDTSSTTGQLLFARPITPLQENTQIIESGQPRQIFTMPLQRLSLMSRYWRGGLKLYIQSSMTNFHYAKLSIVRDYSPSVLALTQYPDYSAVQNLMVETIEFSGGGQTHCIDLPYCSKLNQLECSSSPEVNALQHGMYYIYATQPLIVNGAVPTSVNFNVYLSAGDDFELYGFSDRLFIDNHADNPPLVPALAIEKRETESSAKMCFHGPCSPEKPVIEEETVPLQQAQAQSGNSQLPEQVSEQTLLQPDKMSTSGDPVHTTFFKPIMNLRDYLRRVHSVGSVKYSAEEITYNEGVKFFAISDLIGLGSHAPVSEGGSTPMASILRMFYGVTGGIKLKIKLTGASDLKAYYVPPGTIYAPSNIMYKTNPYPFNGLGNSQVRDNVVQRFKYSTDSHSFALPFIEFTTTTKVASPASTITPDIDRYVSGSVTVLECEIPNMSPYRYIGDHTRNYHLSQPSRNPQNDFGHIVLAIRTEHLIGSESSVRGSGVNIEFFVGASDELRVGFNCMASPSFQETISVGGVQYNIGPYNNPTATATSDPAGPLALLSLFPRAYYTRT